MSEKRIKKNAFKKNEGVVGWGLYVGYSPNRFIRRGPGGVGKGPMKSPGTRLRCRRAEVAVNFPSTLMSPSKTHRKIEILKELLHSVREWHHFMS